MRQGTENSGITQNMHNKRSSHHTSTATPTFCILLGTAAACIISYSFDNQPFNPTVKCCSKNTCNPKHSNVTLLFSEVGKWLNTGKFDFSWWMQVSVIRFLTSYYDVWISHSWTFSIRHNYTGIQVPGQGNSSIIVPYSILNNVLNKMPTICDWHGRILWSLSVQTHIAVRVYSRARPWGISAIWKKMPHKIYVAALNGAQKI